MKRFLSVLITAGVAFSCLTGCGGSSEGVVDKIEGNKGTFEGVAKKVEGNAQSIRLMGHDEAVKILKDADYKEVTCRGATYYIKSGEASEHTKFSQSDVDVYFNLSAGHTVNEAVGSVVYDAEVQDRLFKDYFKLESDDYLPLAVSYAYVSHVEGKSVSTVISEDTYNNIISDLVGDSNAVVEVAYNKEYFDIPCTSSVLSDVVETDDFYVVCNVRDYGKFELTSNEGASEDFNAYFSPYFKDAIKVKTYGSRFRDFEVSTSWYDVDTDSCVFNENGVFNMTGRLDEGNSKDQDDVDMSGVELYGNYDKLCDIVKELDENGLVKRIESGFEYNRRYEIYFLLKGTHEVYEMILDEHMGGIDRWHTAVLSLDDMLLTKSVTADICSALISTFKPVAVGSADSN